MIYRPETELYSHYFEAVMAEQFDAFIWFDETRAVTPLTGPTARERPKPIRSGCSASLASEPLARSQARRA